MRMASFKTLTKSRLGFQEQTGVSSSRLHPVNNMSVSGGTQQGNHLPGQTDRQGGSQLSGLSNRGGRLLGKS